MKGSCTVRIRKGEANSETFSPCKDPGIHMRSNKKSVRGCEQKIAITRFAFCSYKKENENEEFIWGGSIGACKLCNSMDGAIGKALLSKGKYRGGRRFGGKIISSA